MPEQPPPLQPVKVEPAAGVAVRVTAVPLAKEAEHVAPQAMPAGALVTVPLPAPALLTVSVKLWQREGRGDGLSGAHRDGAGAGAGAAAAAPAGERRAGGGRGGKVTAVPLANEAEHVAPQAMPAGALVTVPVRRRLAHGESEALAARRSR